MDVSSSLSAQEESACSSTEGEGGEANSSSVIKESSSQRKSVQTAADVHNVSLSQISSQVQQKEQTVIQMDTDKVVAQERGESSSSDEESSRVGVRSENPELQAREPVESRGRVGGVQSLHGGVLSVANETLLDSRTSSSSSSTRANIIKDSMLDHLSRSQFLDRRSRSSKASASATRDVGSPHTFRDAYLGQF